ncbi:ABC transporter ATP-binding protein [Companilactobacillus ginsenosidimutans]|uniref:ABC transporter ATP-binding protein n=1 Tax=Companilactobacillus ginsenosidimutans TaxID=1007676 RepID=A0A0H4QFM9_9LACO|nr:ABC transporter ATP-binding protein [Companilactobacillus ginsenosidimutans]AKP67219.1 ABC transporter ATP-binding protein [Companilactobacillus ginsenosidimutans]
MSEILKIKDLNYSHRLKRILENVNLTLQSGKIIGLLGENGAGKTTLMRLITGVAQGKGIIEVNGVTKVAERKSKVSYMDHLGAFPLSTRLEKIVKFYATVYEDFDSKRFDELAEFLNIERSLKLSALSKGNKEKFVIALTLSRQCDLYLLDEPFDGIDSMSRKDIINSIIKWKPENSTIVISDHYVSEIAPLLDEIVVIKDETINCQIAADKIREDKGMEIEDFYESLYRGGKNND